MQGRNIYYPFGFDDNGLPTERYVERSRGVRARDLGREAFIGTCLEVSREVEDRFEALWRSLGMSVDWRLRYSTIDPAARRTSQWSFLDLYRKGLVYRAQAPNPWCVECQTAIAQAEIDDLDRATTFYTLSFALDGEGPTTDDQRPTAADEGLRTKDGSSAGAAESQTTPSSQFSIPIATTRPELLGACVAVFVHPDDKRYAGLVGRRALTPLFGRRVPILADALVDPQKGSGAVMCCTFGDSTDVAWWRAHSLPLIALVTRQGRLGDAGGPYAGLTLAEARARTVADLRAAGLLGEERPAAQSVRVHERCGTPLEILETSQWFIRVLDAKEALLEAGRQIAWHPAHMQTRYEHWVANLSWDWCISRQRYYGVPFPLWHCDACGAVVLADEGQLPVDPCAAAPPRACACGSADLRPEQDVMDTWATSSVSPLIAGRFLDDPDLFARLSPMQLRPQAHDIIRTWAFYTIVKAHYHFGAVPWETVMISGHGLDPSGNSIHKSKGNSPIAPGALIERHGADAVRYWACGGSVGSDQSLNEEAMRQGARLTTKLWNAARFIAGHLEDFDPQAPAPALLPADRALLSWLQRLVARADERFRAYDYAAARDAAERFFWGTLCDHYLELVKGRLYDGAGEERRAAQYTLHRTLRTLLQLLAPIMPHITEEIYRRLFAPQGGSVHTSAWPAADVALIDPQAERAGAALLALAGHVRRFKTSRGLGLSTALAGITVAPADSELQTALEHSAPDLRSVTRAQALRFAPASGAGFEQAEEGLLISIEP
jgi:valyl-tRNA synthetase